jgi:hypothetical protein
LIFPVPWIEQSTPSLAGYGNFPVPGVEL